MLLSKPKLNRGALACYIRNIMQHKLSQYEVQSGSYTKLVSQISVVPRALNVYRKIRKHYGIYNLRLPSISDIPPYTWEEPDDVLSVPDIIKSFQTYLETEPVLHIRVNNFDTLIIQHQTTLYYLTYDINAQHKLELREFAWSELSVILANAKVWYHEV